MLTKLRNFFYIVLFYAITQNSFAAAKTGEQIYRQNCAGCHDSGVAEAPKVSDKKYWQTRAKQGINMLYDHAIKGYGTMPPKGGCASCTDEDIKAAVNFIMQHNGK